MKKGPLEYEDDISKRWIDGNVAIIKIKSGVFDVITNVSHAERIFSVFDLIEKDDRLKALLFINDDHVFGERSYEDFLGKILEKNINLEQVSQIIQEDKKLIRAREINILIRYIVKAMEFKKILVSGLQGCIVTPFFGISLASDFRFAKDDMCFSLSHVKYGLHPSGCLAFFLPRFIGHSKAIEILLRGGEISAQEALDLGLINKVYSHEYFEHCCINETKLFCKINARTLQLTKRLLFHFKKEFDEYVENEMKIIE